MIDFLLGFLFGAAIAIAVLGTKLWKLKRRVDKALEPEYIEAPSESSISQDLREMQEYIELAAYRAFGLPEPANRGGPINGGRGIPMPSQGEPSHR